MPLRTSSRVIAAVVVAALALSAVAGCADTEGGSLSLANTKSSAQLLRNSALSRINDEYVSHIIEKKDLSVACGDTADDPDGLMRSWYSSALVDIAADHMHETDVIMQVLADNFSPGGWTADGDGDVRVLTKGSSTSKITLTVVPYTSQLLIESAGPCVATAGPDSDEVTALEGK